MSMGEQLAAAEMHVRNMWEPTGWDSPETAFDLDQEDVDTVIANLAPQRMVKVKVEKAETIVVRAEKSTECTHVSNPFPTQASLPRLRRALTMLLMLAQTYAHCS